MTYGQALDDMLSQQMPYKDQIKKGEVLSFLMQGKMIPFQITSIGWDCVSAVSLCLNYKVDRIHKSKWIAQREILAEIEKQNLNKQ